MGILMSILVCIKIHSRTSIYASLICPIYKSNPKIDVNRIIFHGYCPL